MDVKFPTVVVVTYNRPKSLSRLLTSLINSKYETTVNLIISIDYSDNKLIYEIADNFYWPYGNKEVIKRNSRNGLKKHILSCGDLTYKYGSIIVLEDDLYVSPYYYIYASQALNYYKNSPEIAGISLYTHTTNVHNNAPFYPILNNSDVFFLQFPSSWGQAWTIEQWESFKTWFEKNPTILDIDPIPDNIIRWPDSSWLKHFIKYVSLTDKYFVYPKVSLCTNFSDIGTNFSMKTYEYQRSLQLLPYEYNFKDFSRSLPLYDCYFEINPNFLFIHTKFNEFTDCCIDLYGLKSLNKIENKYLLSIKKCSNPIRSFARHFKPTELNLVFNNLGTGIFLANTNSFDRKLHDNNDNLIFYYSPWLKDLISLTFLKTYYKLLSFSSRYFKIIQKYFKLKLK